MENILKNFYEPVWWFSAFFMSIFTSILAAYFKDVISNILGLFSKKITQYNIERKNKESKMVERISSDPAILIIENIRVTRIFVNVGVVSICTFMMGVVFGFLLNKQSIEVKVLGLLIIVLFEIFTVIGMFKAYSYLAIVNKANGKHRQCVSP